MAELDAEDQRRFWVVLGMRRKNRLPLPLDVIGLLVRRVRMLE
jgi:hypothetical protein